MNTKSVVKAFKTKNFPYKNDRASSDSNLILMNSEIMIMRMQNDPTLKICSVFSNLSSEIGLTTLREDETVEIRDMKFLSDSDQYNSHSRSESFQHKNILALIDNKNRVQIIEIVIDYERESLSCFIFAEMPSQENEDCLQIAWAGEHLLILKEGSLVIDRELKLKNRAVFQKQQYQLPSTLGCKKLIAQKINQNNSLRFFCISGDGKRIYSCDNDSIKQVIVSEILVQEQDEIIEIFICAFKDVIALTRRGYLFQIDPEQLVVLSQSKFNLEQDEVITEAHHDNTLTSLFALTTRNQMNQIFLEKSSNDQIFKSRGLFKFHSKNTLFTFRVLTAPTFLESCIQTKNSHSSKTIQTAFQELRPSPSTVKFFLYSLLQQATENMKIFSLSLATHEILISDREINSLPIQIDSSSQAQEQIIPSSTSVSVDKDQTTQEKATTIPQQSSDKKKIRIISKAPHEADNQKQEACFASKPANPSFLPQQSPSCDSEIFTQLLEQSQQNSEAAQFQQTAVSQNPFPQQQQDQLTQAEHLSSQIQDTPTQETPLKINQAQEQQYQAPQENNIPDGQNQKKKKKIKDNQKSQQKIVSEADKVGAIEGTEENKESNVHSILEGIKESKIEAIFQKNFENVTKTLDTYFETKFNKLDAIVNAKIEKIRKEEDVIKLVEKCSQQQSEKTEAYLKEELDHQYQQYVEPSMRQAMIDMFSQMVKTFEKGQKYYSDKIQQEKEKCKIQNDNSDEILGLVKKITTPFSESAITHKKIITEMSQQSNDRRTKMEQFEKMLNSLFSRQELILTKLSSIEKSSKNL